MVDGNLRIRQQNLLLCVVYRMGVPGTTDLPISYALVTSPFISTTQQSAKQQRGSPDGAARCPPAGVRGAAAWVPGQGQVVLQGVRRAQAGGQDQLVLPG